MTTPAARILVVDDEPGMRRLLKTVLEDSGYSVEVFANGAEALSRLPVADAELVISDVRMPGMDGMTLLGAIRKARRDLPVVLVTAHGRVDSAVQAMKEGATDYLLKPFKNAEILHVVERALAAARLSGENSRLKAELARRYGLGEIIGKSAGMQEVFDLVLRLARTDATVLIQGESGTGKELVARAIHFNGTRSEDPFMAIHCGALPETLLESELFGHVRGAFTDALREHVGLLEAASGGTVFLDEIGEMPPPLQVKLLRFLQNREIRPVGSTQSRTVDVRILAATHRDLREEARLGKFREDLYYRLCVVPLTLPPLRDRKEDLPLLVDRFLAKAAQRLHRPLMAVSPHAMAVLMAHDWPGNIRELENAIEHAIAICQATEVGPDDLPELLPGRLRSSSLRRDWAGRTYKQAKAELLTEFDRRYLSALLEKHKGNISQAALEAGMDRKNFYDILRRSGVNLPQ